MQPFLNKIQQSQIFRQVSLTYAYHSKVTNPKTKHYTYLKFTFKNFSKILVMHRTYMHLINVIKHNVF